MTVTEHLMRPGTFSVGLRSTCPALTVRKILDTIDGAGGHIVITPGRIPEGTDDATVLGLALYTGRIEARPSRGSIEGKGIAAWLGNDDGTTVIETAITKTASSLTTWITDLLVNGITVGTITNTTTYAGTFQYVTYREAIDQVCLAVGAEYELRPNFTINAAAPATLFGSPSVVLTRKPEGVDGQYRGIEGGLLDQSVTASRQVRKIVVVGQGGATGSATNGSLLLKDKAGNAPSLTRLVDAASEPSGNLAGIATATLNLSGVRREFNVSSTSPGVRNYVRPGSYVYVYDVDSGIVDPANQIVFRGEVISPLKVRVLSLSWPIERGMGVYLRSNAATPTYTDLSDYVEFDSGDAFWTVGSERVYETSGAAARLGANPDVIANVNSTGGHRVFAQHSSATSFTVTGTPTVVPLGLEDYDTHNFHNLATNNSRLTVPTGLAGLYQIEARAMLIYGGTTPTVVGVDIRVNASTDSVKNARQVYATGSSTAVTTFVLTYQAVLAAGDYVEMFVSQGGGTSVTTAGDSTSSQATSLKMTYLSG